MRGIKEAALAFDRACRAAGCRYVLVGGFAVMAWGQPRATTAVDVLLELDVSAAKGFVDALGAAGFTVQEEDLIEAFSEGHHVTIFDDQSPYHVDVKPALTAAEIGQIAQGIAVDFEAGRLLVSAPEETIVYKIAFGSEQDLKDARSILVRQAGRLELARLQSLADSLDVAAGLWALQRQVEQAGASRPRDSSSEDA